MNDFSGLGAMRGRREAQQEELSAHIARHDVVITTAQVPGRRPPLLVTEDAVKAMAPGSVIVDMGASALGGNVSGSQPGETTATTVATAAANQGSGLITVAVTPAAAQRIAFVTSAGEQGGSIYLTLVPPDNIPTQLPAVDLNNVIEPNQLTPSG